MMLDDRKGVKSPNWAWYIFVFRAEPHVLLALEGNDKLLKLIQKIYLTLSSLKHIVPCLKENEEQGKLNLFQIILF